MMYLDTELVLMEASNNHVKQHTIGELLDFYINGCDKSSTCEWTTKSNCTYFQGGIAAGAMIVNPNPNPFEYCIYSRTD